MSYDLAELDTFSTSTTWLLLFVKVRDRANALGLPRLPLL